MVQVNRSRLNGVERAHAQHTTHAEVLYAISMHDAPTVRYGLHTAYMYIVCAGRQHLATHRTCVRAVRARNRVQTAAEVVCVWPGLEFRANVRVTVINIDTAKAKATRSDVVGITLGIRCRRGRWRRARCGCAPMRAHYRD